MLMRLHHVQHRTCNLAGQLDKLRAHIMIDESAKKLSRLEPKTVKESCSSLNSHHFYLAVHILCQFQSCQHIYGVKNH